LGEIEVKLKDNIKIYLKSGAGERGLFWFRVGSSDGLL